MDETPDATTKAKFVYEDAPAAPFDVIVDAWFVETFHNIGLDTPTFNRFRAAADRLKARLAKKE